MWVNIFLFVWLCALTSSEDNTGPCASNPCQNGGSCTGSQTSFTCTCPSGYTGDTCEKGPCASNPCRNGGSCTVSSSSYTCTCAGGYTGGTCAGGPCASNPCKNGGSCTGSPTSYTCSCASGYTGDTCGDKCKVGNCLSCQKDPNTCETCKEGFYVTPNKTCAECKMKNCKVCHKPEICDTCKDGFVLEPKMNGSIAKVCNVPAKYACISSPCHNNGTCQVNEDLHGIHCICGPGLMGTFCEKKNPCFPNRCQNNGTCNPIDGSCQCKDLFYGQFCQSSIVQMEEELNQTKAGIVKLEEELSQTKTEVTHLKKQIQQLNTTLRKQFKVKNIRSTETPEAKDRTQTPEAKDRTQTPKAEDGTQAKEAENSKQAKEAEKTKQAKEAENPKQAKEAEKTKQTKTKTHKEDGEKDKQKEEKIEHAETIKQSPIAGFYIKLMAIAAAAVVLIVAVYYRKEIISLFKSKCGSGSGSEESKSHKKEGYKRLNTNVDETMNVQERAREYIY